MRVQQYLRVCVMGSVCVCACVGVCVHSTDMCVHVSAAVYACVCMCVASCPQMLRTIVPSGGSPPTAGRLARRLGLWPGRSHLHAPGGRVTQRGRQPARAQGRGGV